MNASDSYDETLDEFVDLFARGKRLGYVLAFSGTRSSPEELIVVNNDGEITRTLKKEGSPPESWRAVCEAARIVYGAVIEVALFYLDNGAEISNVEPDHAAALDLLRYGIGDDEVNQKLAACRRPARFTRTLQ